MLIRSSRFLNFLGIAAGRGTVFGLNAARTARKGNLFVGDLSLLTCRFSFDRPEAQIVVGSRCHIGKSHIVSASSVVIEDDVLISWGVTIDDHNSHALDWHGRKNDMTDWHVGRKDWSVVQIRPILIKRRSWIGFNATILKGVTVGEGAIIGAASVVTRDVPPYTVVAGNPARIIRTLERKDD